MSGRCETCRFLGSAEALFDYTADTESKHRACLRVIHGNTQEQRDSFGCVLWEQRV